MGTFGAEWAAAVSAQTARREAVARFHVQGLPYVHPGNLWTLREDGLYELAGSARAFDSAQIVPCTSYDGRTGDCSCQL